MRHSTLIAAIVITCVVAGCGKQETASPTPTAAAVDAATPRASDTAALQPNQTLQGSIEADLGRGAQSFRSVSTRIADNVGQQIDAAMKKDEGRKALDDANRKLEKLGTGMRVDAGDVKSMIGGMAGKTFHDATVLNVPMIHALQVSIDGRAADGSRLSLSLSFNAESLGLVDSSLDYRPDGKKLFDFYESTGDAPLKVTIERFEKNADGSYAIAGRFHAVNLPASKMAKTLASPTLAKAEGHFAYEALPLKQMPKFGTQG